MNWQAIELHQAELELIADAAVPNKDQNRAIKNLMRSAINTLMNRIAEGWLNEKLAPTSDPAVAEPSPFVANQPGGYPIGVTGTYTGNTCNGPVHS